MKTWGSLAGAMMKGVGYYYFAGLIEQVLLRKNWLRRPELT